MPEPTKSFGIFVGPLSIVRLKADKIVNERGVLAVYRGQELVAEFTSWLAWVEDEQEAKEPGKVLSMVRNGDGPTAAT